MSVAPPRFHARFHVRAWGSDKHPDLDYVTDAVPADLTWRYPCVDVAAMTPVLRSEPRNLFEDM